MKLTIKGLTKSYEFGPGIYGILGANGAGKSTLFELLTDTLRRDCGEILWNGVDILKLGGRYRAKVGYMPRCCWARASAPRPAFPAIWCRALWVWWPDSC